MNDYLLFGIVAIGIILALGGGAWIAKVFSRKNAPPKA